MRSGKRSCGDYPDSHLSPAKLQVKRCVALARLGRTEQLAAAAGRLREQSGGQRVTIGGQEVDAAEFAQALLSAQPHLAAAAGATAAKNAEASVLPIVDEPLWQIRAGSETLTQIERQLVNNGWNQEAHLSGVVPPAAVDDQRVYVNWFGIVYAADLKTGKMLWRTGKFSDIAAKATLFIEYGMKLDRGSLSVHDGRVFATRQEVPNGRPNSPDQLECFDAATGSSLWTSGNMGLIGLSAPYVVDGLGYVVGIGSSDATMYLTAVNLKTGRAEWKVDLGKPQGANNYRGGVDFATPNLLAADGLLYVASNNGALLAVNLSERRLEWAFQHDTSPSAASGRIFFYGMNLHSFETPGTLLDDQGTLYLKDSSARVMYAIDRAAPCTLWKRPISSEEMVVGIAGDVAYLLGHDLSALDLKTKELRWSVKIPATTGSLRPIVGARHIYVPSSRGIYDVDPASGDIRRIFRGADREAAGGRLFVAGGKLICVTDTAVTAYPLEAAEAAR